VGELFHHAILKTLPLGISKKLLTGTMGATAGIRELLTPNKRNLPLPAQSNEAIGRGEKQWGFFNSPHQQTYVFLSMLNWENSTYTPALEEEIAESFGIPADGQKQTKLQRVGLKSALEAKRQAVSQKQQRYLGLEPIILTLISEARKKYGQQKAPVICPDNNRRRGRKLKFGRSEKFSDDRTVRLVFPDFSRQNYYFADISYRNFLSLIHRVPAPDKNPFLFAQLLAAGAEPEEFPTLANLGIRPQPVSAWFDHRSSICTIGVKPAVDINPHLNDILHDPGTALNFTLEYAFDQESKTCQPTKLRVRASHQPATGYQLTQLVNNKIMPLASIRQSNDGGEMATAQTIDTDAGINVIPVINPWLRQISPVLSQDQAALFLMGFTNKGAAELAKICNLNEIIWRFRLPQGLVSLNRYNSRLAGYLADRFAGFPAGVPTDFTDCLMHAAVAQSGKSAMLSVMPEGGENLPAALEMALLCNGALEPIRGIIARTITAVLRPEFAGSGFLPAQATDIVSKDSLPWFTAWFSNNAAYQIEKSRAKKSYGTPGLLARLAGPLRQSLEKTSNKIAAPLMAQLLSLIQISNLGKMPENMKGKVVQWLFDTSWSLFVKRGVGISDDEFSVRIKVFDDTVTTWQIINQYGNRDLLLGLLDRIEEPAIIAGGKKVNLSRLDHHDRVARRWLIGKIRQIDETLPDKIAAAKQEIKDYLFSETISSVNSVITMEKLLGDFIRARTPVGAKITNIDHLSVRDQKKVAQFLKQLAWLKKISYKETLDQYNQKIAASPKGIWTFATVRDPAWKAEHEAAVSARADMQAQQVQLDLVDLYDDVVFTNLDSFIAHAQLDANLYTEMVAVADRLSYALTEHLSRHSDAKTQITAINNIYQLVTGEQSLNLLTNAVLLTVAQNAYLIRYAVSQLYQTATVSLSREKTSNWERLVAEQLPHFNPANTDDLKDLCILAKTYRVPPSRVINYLFRLIMTSTGIENWLQTTLPPTSKISDTICSHAAKLQ
jgi:hypothetical protein